MGHLGAEVAAGDHHRAGRLDDAVEVVDGGAGLDLGHDQRAAGVRLDADAADVVGGAHERERDHVDARPRRRRRAMRRSSGVGVVSRRRSDGMCTPGPAL